MFNNNENDEISFSEAYKSEILGNSQKKSDKSSLSKIIIILLLVVIIVGLGIFGYFYFTQKQETESTQTAQPPKTSQMLDNIEELEKEALLAEEPEKAPSTENNITEKVEKETAVIKEKIEAPKETPKSETTQKGEETYLEQLAELSKEIDGEK